MADCSSLQRPNVGYNYLRSIGNYWLMFERGGYNVIYADVGANREYFAQPTSIPTTVYGAWYSYDEVVAWIDCVTAPAPTPTPTPTPELDVSGIAVVSALVIVNAALLGYAALKAFGLI